MSVINVSYLNLLCEKWCFNLYFIMDDAEHLFMLKITCIMFSISAFSITNANFSTGLLVFCYWSIKVHFKFIHFTALFLSCFKLFYPFIICLDVIWNIFVNRKFLIFIRQKLIFSFLIYRSVTCLRGLSHSKITKKSSHAFPCITFVVLMSYFLKLEMRLLVSLGKWTPT